MSTSGVALSSQQTSVATTPSPATLQKIGSHGQGKVVCSASMVMKTLPTPKPLVNTINPAQMCVSMATQTLTSPSSSVVTHSNNQSLSNNLSQMVLKPTIHYPPANTASNVGFEKISSVSAKTQERPKDSILNLNSIVTSNIELVGHSQAGSPVTMVTSSLASKLLATSSIVTGTSTISPSLSAKMDKIVAQYCGPVKKSTAVTVSSASQANASNPLVAAGGGTEVMQMVDKQHLSMTTTAISEMNESQLPSLASSYQTSPRFSGHLATIAMTTPQTTMGVLTTPTQGLPAQLLFSQTQQGSSQSLTATGQSPLFTTHHSSPGILSGNTLSTVQSSQSSVTASQNTATILGVSSSTVSQVQPTLSQVYNTSLLSGDLQVCNSGQVAPQATVFNTFLNQQLGNVNQNLANAGQQQHQLLGVQPQTLVNTVQQEQQTDTVNMGQASGSLSHSLLNSTVQNQALANTSMQMMEIGSQVPLNVGQNMLAPALQQSSGSVAANVAICPNPLVSLPILAQTSQGQMTLQSQQQGQMQALDTGILQGTQAVALQPDMMQSNNLVTSTQGGHLLGQLQGISGQSSSLVQGTEMLSQLPGMALSQNMPLQQMQVLIQGNPLAGQSQLLQLSGLQQNQQMLVQGSYTSSSQLQQQPQAAAQVNQLPVQPQQVMAQCNELVSQPQAMGQPQTLVQGTTMPEQPGQSETVPNQVPNLAHGQLPMLNQLQQSLVDKDTISATSRPSSVSLMSNSTLANGQAGFSGQFMPEIEAAGTSTPKLLTNLNETGGVVDMGSNQGNGGYMAVEGSMTGGHYANNYHQGCGSATPAITQTGNGGEGPMETGKPNEDEPKKKKPKKSKKKKEGEGMCETIQV